MSGKKLYVQAIADNNGETDTELVFKRGEIIVVVETDTGSEGWWEGYLLRDKSGQSGFFPESFAVPIISCDQTPPEGVYLAQHVLFMISLVTIPMIYLYYKEKLF